MRHLKTKLCSKCGKTRQLKFFNKDVRYRLGVKGWCKTCESDYGRSPARKKAHKVQWQKYMSNPENRERERIRSSRKYHRDPKHAKDLVLRRAHGISLQKFERTKRCLLCKRKVRLVADHNHKTGRYRGALCILCNMIIGWVERHQGILKRIGLYLRRG